MSSLLDIRKGQSCLILLQTSTSSLLGGPPSKPMSNGDLNSEADTQPSALSQDSSLSHPTASKKMSAPVSPVGGVQQHARYPGRSFSLRQPASTRRQSDTPLVTWCVPSPYVHLNLVYVYVYRHVLACDCVVPWARECSFGRWRHRGKVCVDRSCPMLLRLSCLQSNSASTSCGCGEWTGGSRAPAG